MTVDCQCFKHGRCLHRTAPRTVLGSSKCILSSNPDSRISSCALYQKADGEVATFTEQIDYNVTGFGQSVDYAFKLPPNLFTDSTYIFSKKATITGIEPQDALITKLENERDQLLKEQLELLVVLKATKDALKFAGIICDAVPSKLHLNENESLSYIGKLVNQAEGCYGGYAIIRDAEEMKVDETSLDVYCNKQKQMYADRVYRYSKANGAALTCIELKAVLNKFL